MTKTTILFVIVLAGCRSAEPGVSSDVATPSATAEATSEATAQVTASPSATQLGAVSLPDTKRCVEECSGQHKAGSVKSTDSDAECRKRCKEQCLEHCKQKRSNIPDFETVCARDCDAQQELVH